MPHITLLYPYRPVSAFKTAVPRLTRACRSLGPFDVRLERFEVFTHDRSATVYLAAEPAAAFKDLHGALLTAAPDCDDTARFAGGFRPHLSVAQATRPEAERLCARWQAAWQPMVFTVRHVHVVWRNEPPDDVFRSGPAAPLGKPEA
jgi:2'-5' RNA ligase